MYMVCKDALKDFYNLDSIFINDFINHMISFAPNLLSTPEYGLFYNIRSNIQLNYFIFENTNIELDSAVFPSVKRNTRSCIESFIDLYNLTNDSSKAYLELLKKIEIDAIKNCREQETLKNRLNFNKDIFSLFMKTIFPKTKTTNYWVAFSTKINIAKKLGLIDNVADSFHTNFKQYSPYSHSSIFIEYEKCGEIQLHHSHVSSLLILNLQLLKYSIESIYRMYIQTYSILDSNQQILLNDVNNIKNLIDALAILVENTPNIIMAY